MKYSLVFLLTFLVFSLTLLNGQTTQTNNSSFEKTVQQELRLSQDLILTDLEKSIVHAKRTEELLPKIKSTILQCKILNNLSDIYKAKGDLPSSMRFLLQSKTKVETELLKNPKNHENQLIQASVFIKIGSLNLQLKNFKKSLSYYNKALTIIKQANTSSAPQEFALTELKIYNNIAAVLMQKKDFDTALTYLQNALLTNQTVKDETVQSTLLNNIGICYLEEKETKSADDFLQKSLILRKKLGDKQGQAQVLNNMGKNEIYRGNFTKAKYYFLTALHLSQEIGSKQSAIVSLESLYMVNDTLKNYKEALTYFKAFKTVNDSIFNLENQTTINNLETAHKLDIEKKKLESNQLKSQIRTFALAGVILFILLLSSVVILSMRNKVRNSQLKQEKLELEREKLQLEHTTLHENLQFKERELTANALYLLKNNELIQKINEDLSKAKLSFSKENQTIIQEVLNDLRTNQNNSMWNEFEAHFTKVHANFYPSLQEKFPTLTSNEKKLCAFLRLNMSTKDISAITHQSVNSITVARSRLRKKLNIEGEDTHLVNFLMEI